MQGGNICDRDGCRQCIEYEIQLDNVRAQNETIRNIEPSDIINSSQTPAWHISKESLAFWEEDAEQIFVDFSKYNDSVRLAIKNTTTVMHSQIIHTIFLISLKHINRRNL